MKITELLKEFQDNPERLELLAQALELSQAQEEQLENLTAKVDDLQDSNRKLFKMLPVHDEPKVEPTDEPIQPMSAQEALTNLLVKED